MNTNNPTDPNTINLPYSPDTIRVETQPNVFVSLDILFTKYAFDDVIKAARLAAAPDTELNSLTIIEKIQAWFQTQYQQAISPSTAYKLFVMVEDAYDLLKKKLVTCLASHTITTSIPSSSFPVTVTPVTNSSSDPSHSY